MAFRTFPSSLVLPSHPTSPRGSAMPPDLFIAPSFILAQSWLAACGTVLVEDAVCQAEPPAHAKANGPGLGQPLWSPSKFLCQLQFQPHLGINTTSSHQPSWAFKRPASLACIFPFFLPSGSGRCLWSRLEDLAARLGLLLCHPLPSASQPTTCRVV